MHDYIDLDKRNTEGHEIIKLIKNQKVLISSNLSLCFSKLNLHEKCIRTDEMVNNKLKQVRF